MSSLRVGSAKSGIQRASLTVSQIMKEDQNSAHKLCPHSVEMEDDTCAEGAVKDISPVLVLGLRICGWCFRVRIISNLDSE